MLQTQGPAGSGGSGAWPVYVTSQDNYLRLDTVPNRVVVTGVHSAVCDMWDAVDPPVHPLTLWPRKV